MKCCTSVTVRSGKDKVAKKRATSFKTNAVGSRARKAVAIKCMPSKVSALLDLETLHLVCICELVLNGSSIRKPVPKCVASASSSQKRLKHPQTLPKV